MAEFLINDWSQGLISSDDDINGRKNGFLRMDNVELDQNGAITLTGGTVKLDAVYANTIHTIYSKFLGVGTPESPQYRYAADVNGNIFRSNVTNTNIGTGGSTTRATFLAVLEYVLIASGAKRLKDDGTTVTNLGQGTITAPTVALNGAGILSGSYRYAQVNVFVNSSGGYRARSAPSPIVTIATTNNKVQVTPVNVSGAQNEVWIFRQGGLLDQFYRVKRITSSYTTPFDDNLADLDALADGTTLNILALPVDSTNLPDAILEMVGPINGRILYFTAKTVYFSETYSPESYVPGQGVFLMGAPQTAETFLWARKVAANVVMIGTTKDVYRLTGTLIEQSDGTLDVSIKPTSVDAPPISIDVDLYNNNLIYMSAYGWVMCDQYGATTPLCPPNVDVNYYGKTRYGVSGVPIYVASPDKVYRYCVAIIRNKAFFVIPESTSYPPTRRVDVYDFTRKYWRSIRYVSNNAPLMIKSQEDHTIIGYFDNDKFIKRLDDQFTFTFDNGPAVNQTINLLTPFYDCQLSRNRKDAANLKFKIDTGGVNFAVNLYKDGNGSSATSLGNLNSNGMSEVFIDLNTYFAAPLNIFKSFQLSFSGAVPTLRLSDISFNYEARPEQRSFYRIPITNFGSASKKRIRTWPHVLDTLGNTVTFTPTVDGTNMPTSTFTAANKSTFLHFFKTDVFGIDYGGIFTCPALFEVYEPMQPEAVQVLPIAKQFDQIGPEELARYGKIRQFEVCLLPFGTSVPFTIYFQDASSVTGTITVVNGVEDVYPILISKTTSGQVIRLELGPTSFNFHRFYIRVQIVRSGKDSDMEWKLIESLNSNGV